VNFAGRQPVLVATVFPLQFACPLINIMKVHEG
jgi:hypothetical protein